MSIATGAVGVGVVPGVVDGGVVPLPVEVEGGVGAGVGAGVEVDGVGVDVAGGVEGVVVGVFGVGAEDVLGGIWTLGSVLLPVLVLVVGVEVVGAVVVAAGGGVVAAGGAVAGGVCATCAAFWLGGAVWSSRSAAYEAATAPATSRAVRPRTVIEERNPGRSPRRPEAVPQLRHQSPPGSSGSPQDLHVRVPGSGLTSSGGASCGGSGGAPGATSGWASSSFIGRQGCTTWRRRRRPWSRSCEFYA